jgi:hypothetical protein
MPLKDRNTQNTQIAIQPEGASALPGRKPKERIINEKE